MFLFSDGKRRSLFIKNKFWKNIAVFRELPSISLYHLCGCGYISGRFPLRAGNVYSVLFFIMLMMKQVLSKLVTATVFLN